MKHKTFPECLKVPASGVCLTSSSWTLLLTRILYSFSWLWQSIYIFELCSRTALMHGQHWVATMEWNFITAIAQGEDKCVHIYCTYYKMETMCPLRTGLWVWQPLGLIVMSSCFAVSFLCVLNAVLSSLACCFYGLRWFRVSGEKTLCCLAYFFI